MGDVLLPRKLTSFLLTGIYKAIIIPQGKEIIPLRNSPGPDLPAVLGATRRSFPPGQGSIRMRVAARIGSIKEVGKDPCEPATRS